MILSFKEQPTWRDGSAASFLLFNGRPPRREIIQLAKAVHLSWTEFAKNNLNIPWQRVHRVTLTATILAVAYFLTFFNFLSVPLLDSGIAEKLLPVVSIRYITKCVVLSDYYFTSSPVFVPHCFDHWRRI